MLREMKDSLCIVIFFCHKIVIFPLIKPVTNLVFKVSSPKYMCVGCLIHKAMWDLWYSLGTKRYILLTEGTS